MDKRFPHPFSETAKKYRTYRSRLPDKVSTMALEEIKGYFKVGGYRDTSTVYWKKRRAESWKKKKADSNRALLIKTGRLRRSLRKSPSYDFARVVTNVPYAEALNSGFKGTVKQTVKAFNRKKGKVKGFTRTIQQNIEARPFLTIGDAFMNVLERDVLKDLETIFLKA